MTVAPLSLDPTKNPDPYGSQSTPDPDELEDILTESVEIASCFTLDWRPGADVIAMSSIGTGTWAACVARN
jgi:hypothetical protein